jgi:hypothetical protein
VYFVLKTVLNADLISKDLVGEIDKKKTNLRLKNIPCTTQT